MEKATSHGVNQAEPQPCVDGTAEPRRKVAQSIFWSSNEQDSVLRFHGFFNQNVLGPFKTNAHLNHQSAGFSKFLTTGDILILAGPLRSVSQWNCHFGSCGLGVVGCEPLSKLATKWWCEGWGMKDDVSLQVIGWKVCNEQEGKYFQIKSQRNRLWQYNKTTCHF